MSESNPGLMTIFAEALEQPDAVACAAYLDRACGGDSALRKRVEALLAAHAGAGHFLEPDATAANEPGVQPASRDVLTAAYQPGASADAPPNGPDAGTAPRTVIAGRYTLIGVIGEGGMGSVYRAEQTEPVKRQVALKLIKSGTDSKAVLARFDAERQALALMDHPNIACVYDGGTTEQGQPFFVMELVQGMPLTTYSDHKRLSVKARLELFVSVCQAVQHAHQKGIIHRDLKPSNVLVTEVDGRPTPKVIDFGVAKATEVRLTDLSYADTGAIVGTPAYMSPEQADPSSMDIDTRTDVYALGVMLYELLVGSPPLDAKRFKRGALLEMLRMVREVDPPRPSTKLSAADDLPSIAANRDIEPAQLANALRGELDWVVMKALDKDRTRRYDSANAFAHDLQRYLADEVVEARPPTCGYRLRKFVKRNKVQVTAASLVLLALLAGIVGTTWGLIIARHETAEKEKAREAQAKRVVERDKALLDAKLALEREGKRVKERDHQIANSTFLLAGAAADSGNLPLARRRLDDIDGEYHGWEWHQLLHRTEGGIFTLYGHLGPAGARRVVYSSDGMRFATVGDTNTKVWDARTGVLQFVLPGTNGAAFSPNGKRIAVGNAGAVKVRDLSRHLDKPTGRPHDGSGLLQFELKGHIGKVSSVAFSPDGTRIATGDEGSPKVWDAKTGSLQVTLTSIRGPVNSMAFSPDGTRILTIYSDVAKQEGGGGIIISGLVNVLDAKTGALRLKNQWQGVNDAAFSPDGNRVVIGMHGEVAVLDAQTAKPLLEFLTGTSPALSAVSCVAYSPDGSRIATANHQDSTVVKIWDAKKGTLQLELNGHRAPVFSVAFSPDGMRILSGSTDGTAKIWDVGTGPTQKEFLGVAGVFSPDGLRFATARDNTTTVWDVRTGSALLELKGGGGALLGADLSVTETVFENTVIQRNRSGAFSPNGTLFTTCDNDDTAKAWDLSRPDASPLVLKGHTKPVMSVDYSPDGKYIVTGSLDKTATVWEASTGKPLMNLTGHMAGVYAVAYSPDGKTIATGSLDQTAKVWNAKTGKVLLNLKGHTDHVSCVAYGPDSTRIVTGAWSTGPVVPVGPDRLPGEVKVWDARTGEILMDLKGHLGGVCSVACSPDGTRILSGGVGMTVKVWDSATGIPLRELAWKEEASAQRVSGIALSRTGNRLLVSDCYGVTRVCDARVRAPRLELKARSEVLNAAFSPNGTRIVTGSLDGAVSVWDAKTGKALLELKGYTVPVTNVAYSGDGARIVTGGQKFNEPSDVKVWDAATGKFLVELKGIDRPVTSVAFSVDATRIVGRLELDASEQVWDATTGKSLQGEIPRKVPNQRFNPDGRFFLHLDRDRVEVIPTEPDQDEFDFRRLHTLPSVWAYRQRYYEMLSADDTFAARFFFNLLPAPVQQEVGPPP